MTTQRGEDPATGFLEDQTRFPRPEPRTPADDAPQPDGVLAPPGTTRAERRRAREAAEAAARPFTDAFVESPSGTTWLRPDLDGDLDAAAHTHGAHAARTDGAQLNGPQLNGAQSDRAQVDGAPVDGAPVNGAPVNGAQLDGTLAGSTPTDGARLNGGPATGAHAGAARAGGARAGASRADGGRVAGSGVNGGATGAHAGATRADGGRLNGGGAVGEAVVPGLRGRRPPAGAAAEPGAQAGRVADGDVAGVGFDPGNTGTWRVRDVVPGADGGRRTTTILRYLLGLLAIDHVRALTRWAFALPFVGLLLLLVHPRWIGLAVIVLGVLLIVARIAAVRLISRRTLPRRYRPVEDDLRAAVEAGKANLRGELRRVGMPSSALALPRSVVRLGSSDSRSTARSQLRDIEIDRVLPRAQLDRALRVLDGAPTPR